MPRLWLIVAAMGFAGQAAAQTSVADSRDLGFGLALGVQPSPGSVCTSEGDLTSCTTWLPAWAFRAQVTHALGTRLSASLVAGFGTDLDATERVSSDGGRGEDGRQFMDLLLRARYDLGQEGKTGWVAFEAGAIMARDWASDFAADGDRTAHRSAVQYAPVVGAIAGLVLLRERSFVLDLEVGARLTAFGAPAPPSVRQTGERVGGGSGSEYGVRPWIWLGLGGRFWR